MYRIRASGPAAKPKSTYLESQGGGMSAILLTPPALEPVSLSEAKQFLRVDHDDDDAVITSLIAAARAQIEALTRRALLTQTWRIVRDAWPSDGRLRAGPAPLQTVVAARVFDTDGNAISFDPSVFIVEAEHAMLAAPAFALPAPGRIFAGIEIDVVSGFGDDAEDVPAPLRQAIRHLVAHWYDNRGLVAIGGTLSMMPASVNAMIGAYRALSL